MPIFEELRRLIRSDDRSHSVIAQAAAIHPKTFSAFLHGRRGLSIETAESLARALGHKLVLTKERR